MKINFNKTICLFLLLGLNWASLFSIGQTMAYFNDAEISQDNTMDAGRLDFMLVSENDFQPEVDFLQNSTKTITVQDSSTMDYVYRVKVDNLIGGLCDYLFLDDGISGGMQPLTSFTSIEVLYSEKQQWVFEGSLNVENPGWEGRICQFDFVYEGWQENMFFGSGFYDVEIISNIIINIREEIPTCMKINEVYYDPGVRINDFGVESDPDDEWIELYNNCDYEVNLKDWYLYDNNSYEHLNHNYIILPHQFVVIAANSSTWTYWPDIPDNAFKIALGKTRMFSHGLSNDGDVVLIHDNQDNRIDEVSWGTDITGLDPSVPDVPEGHSISRKEKGVDTDTKDDWMDTYSGSVPPGPNPGTNPHTSDGSLLLPTALPTALPTIVQNSEAEETEGIANMLIDEQNIIADENNKENIIEDIVNTDEDTPNMEPQNIDIESNEGTVAIEDNDSSDTENISEESNEVQTDISQNIEEVGVGIEIEDNIEEENIEEIENSMILIINDMVNNIYDINQGSENNSSEVGASEEIIEENLGAQENIENESEGEILIDEENIEEVSTPTEEVENEDSIIILNEDNALTFEEEYLSSKEILIDDTVSNEEMESDLSSKLEENNNESE